MAHDEQGGQPPKVTYYAKIDDEFPRERPMGLVRRIHTEPLPTDEALGRDLTWHPTEYLHRYWLGHNDIDHVEISKDEADAIIARWRVEFAGRETGA
jgi:hypothetical protein